MCSVLTKQLSCLTETLSYVQLMLRMEQLRQLRVQTGVLDLQPPHNAAGHPTYRGAASELRCSKNACARACACAFVCVHC